MKIGGSVMPLQSLILLDLGPIVDSFGPKFDSQLTRLVDLGVFFGSWALLLTHYNNALNKGTHDLDCDTKGIRVVLL